MRISSMSNLMKFMLADHKWAWFRGQRESTWKIESTIERTINLNPALSGNEQQLEKSIIKKFKENAHLYDKDFTNYTKSEFSTLTYIQHHGAPTRLLDFSESKFVALFFAFDELDSSNSNNFVRLWYFDIRDIIKRTSELTGQDLEYLYSSDEVWNSCVSQNNYDAIFYLRPNLNSQRSHIQKGSFVCTGKIDTSMHDIFTTSYKDVIKYIDIHKKLQKDVYALLNQVNISHKTLYGGIEGFAKDIKNGFALIS